MTKKLILTISLLLTIHLMSNAQNKSIVLAIGTNSLSADVGYSNLEGTLKNNLGYLGSISYRYSSLNRFGYAIKASYDYYRGKDSEKSSRSQKYFFNTATQSLGIQAEYLLFGNNEDRIYSLNSFYVFSGLRCLHYTYHFDVIETGNEFTASILAGIGYQYRFSHKYSLGLEITQDFFLSDKLDGYNPKVSGNKFNDMALSAKLTFSFHLPANYGRKRWDIEYE